MVHKVSKHVGDRMEMDLVYKKLEFDPDNVQLNENGNYNLDLVLQAWLEFDEEE